MMFSKFRWNGFDGSLKSLRERNSGFYSEIAIALHSEPILLHVIFPPECFTSLFPFLA